MKKFFAAALVLMAAAGLYAQNTFFAAKKGMVLTYAMNDAKGKANAYSVLTIKDVKGSASNMTITYGAETLDKNRRPLRDSPGEQTLQVVVKDNVVILDMKELVPPELKQQGVQMEVTGTPMELPNRLQPGQTLKDADITLTMDLGITKMSTVMKMTGGTCLAIEDVTVPAGTFKCHKISQTVTTTTMRRDTVTKTISWYAPGIGTVKTETYNDKDKLLTSTVLVELRGN